MTRAALTAYAGPEVVAYARARSEAVTSLVSEVATAVADEGRGWSSWTAPGR
nr:hypothetical protein GCM10020093_095570 [Planobispora longispora]